MKIIHPFHAPINLYTLSKSKHSVNISRMEDYTVEKGIPVPPATKGKGRDMRLCEAMKRMEVGDSILFSKGQRTALPYSVVRYNAKRAGITVTIRKVGEDSVRFWRTA